MKTRILFVMGAMLAAVSTGTAQDMVMAPPFDASQLDQLLSPIALYPDPLLGAMLPAATHPSDVAAAASFAANNIDPAQIDQQPWDDSVKDLAHYPSVVEWMAQNQDWTNQLGTAVANEQPAVLDSIQRLRENARASGLLVDTPQQRVVVENNVISIIPAQSDMVYVPSYDAQYLEAPPAGAPQVGISFSVGYPIGSWPLFGLDWRAHSVWVDHDRERDRDWSRIAVAPPPTREVWRPERMAPPERYTTNRYQPQARDYRQRVTRPTPFSDRNRGWRPSQAITPTGRINSPAMEYSTPTQNRWNESRVAPQPRPGNVRTYPQPNANRNDHGRTEDKDHRDRDRRREDHDRRDGDDQPDR